MNDPPSNATPTSRAGAECESNTTQGTERQRLIDDLAFLVVRQHRRQQRYAVSVEDQQQQAPKVEAKDSTETRQDR